MYIYIRIILKYILIYDGVDRIVYIYIYIYRERERERERERPIYVYNSLVPLGQAQIAYIEE